MIAQLLTGAAAAVLGAATAAFFVWPRPQPMTPNYTLDGRTPELRAQELLKAHLSPEQWRDFTLLDHFYEVGHATKTKYLLDSAGSIWSHQRHYCIAAIDQSGGGIALVPRADKLLALVLCLRHDETLFLKTANASHYPINIP